MQINSDFSQRVVIRPADYEFIPSPLKGVSRMMLDRAGKEVAPASSATNLARATVATLTMAEKKFTY